MYLPNDSYYEVPITYSGEKNKWHKILCKMGKSAVALWKPCIEKWFVPHLKAVNVSFSLKYQTLQTL